MVPKIASHDQELLAHLARTPGWQALTALGAEKKEREYGRLAKALMRGEQIPDLEYRRGFLDGIDFILRNPDLAANKLDKALAQERGDTSGK